MNNKPKILFYDVETAPILAYVWDIWEQNVGLNQIKRDWCILSWAAKWLDSDKIMYMDQRHVKNIEDDKELLRGIWKLLDEADIVVTQNGKAFDEKKLNARFILNGMNPPSPYLHVDTKKIAKKKFAFTSNKLEYMSEKLNKKYKKLKHEKFSGFELWKECLSGNIKAWKEMEKYNKYDVLALEELYLKMRAWDDSINLAVFNPNGNPQCECGSTHVNVHGYKVTKTGRYQRYQCQSCGAIYRDRRNLLTREQKDRLKIKIT